MKMEKVYPKIKPSEKLRKAISSIKNLNDHHDYQRLAHLIILHGNIPSFSQKASIEYDLFQEPIKCCQCTEEVYKIEAITSITYVNGKKTVDHFCSSKCEIFANLDILGEREGVELLTNYLLEHMERLKIITIEADSKYLLAVQGHHNQHLFFDERITHFEYRKHNAECAGDTELVNHYTAVITAYTDVKEHPFFKQKEESN